MRAPSGRIAVTARVDTPTSRVGDPVTLTVSVRGTGNVSLFPRPSIALPWGDAVNGAERVAIDSGVALVQGRKEFEWVVTPRREGTLEVPALRYPYWNPYTEQYEGGPDVARSPCAWGAERSRRVRAWRSTARRA
jgi:hypothetical protein